MKTYREMADDVFRRMEAYETAQKKKRQAITHTAVALCGVGLVALAGVGVWRSQTNGTPPPAAVQDSLYPGVPDTVGDRTSGDVTVAPTTFDTTTPDYMAVTPQTSVPTSQQTVITTPQTSAPTNTDEEGGKKIVALNMITGVINAVPLYRDPACHYEETWDAGQMAAHLGVDLRGVVDILPAELTYTGTGGFTVTFQNDGTLVEDRAAFTFTGQGGRAITILASRVGLPYDCLYQLETQNPTPLRLRTTGEVIEVLVGAKDPLGTDEGYGLYVADFAYHGVNYRIKGEGISPAWIDPLIREIAGE